MIPGRYRFGGTSELSLRDIREAERAAPSPLLTDEGALGSCQDERTRRRCPYWGTCMPRIIRCETVVCLADATVTELEEQQVERRAECDKLLLAYLRTCTEPVTFQAMLIALGATGKEQASLRESYKGALMRFKNTGKVECTGETDVWGTFRRGKAVVNAQRPVKLWRLVNGNE